MQVNLANFNEIHRPIYVLEEERLYMKTNILKQYETKTCAIDIKKSKYSQIICKKCSLILGSMV